MYEKAKQTLREIDDFLNSTVNPEVSKQLLENKNAIIELLNDIARTDFSAAFIGKIGVGKTSAICRLAGLQFISKENKVVDLLKTGQGRVTMVKNGRRMAVRAWL